MLQVSLSIPAPSEIHPGTSLDTCQVLFMCCGGSHSVLPPRCAAPAYESMVSLSYRVVVLKQDVKTRWYRINRKHYVNLK